MNPQQVNSVEAEMPVVQRPTSIRVPEIARRLGVGRLKIYAMLEAGVIPGIHFGRKWIITRFAYENWERTCGVKASIVEVQ
jgi:excisionase family DNA binding protein